VFVDGLAHDERAKVRLTLGVVGVAVNRFGGASQYGAHGFYCGNGQSDLGIDQVTGVAGQ
jgi:hypothetical protein